MRSEDGRPKTEDGGRSSVIYRCEVIDTGAGIAPATLARLFQPFPPGYHVRALVVDDVLENRALLSEMLQGIRCIVEVAEDGFRALERLRANWPDIVFLDIRMPGLDGLEVARRIDAEFGQGRTRLVAISASAFIQEQERFMKEGMETRESKPAAYGVAANEYCGSAARSGGSRVDASWLWDHEDHAPTEFSTKFVER